MRPYSLQRAVCCRICGILVKAVEHRSVIKQEHKEELVSILVWLAKENQQLSLPMLQNELHTKLVERLKCRINSAAYFTCFLVLCHQVTTAKLKVNLEPGDTLSQLGLTIRRDESRSILEVIEEVQGQLPPLQTCAVNVGGEQRPRGVKRKWKVDNINVQEEAEPKPAARNSPPLPTKSLVLEAVNFRDPDFLPRLLEWMPGLRHVSLQHDFASSTVQSMSRYCKELESLCFQRNYKNVFTILFGVPPHLVAGNVLQRFCEDGEDYRRNFAPQFPNLKEMDLYEGGFDCDTKHGIHVLALVLQPKLQWLGKNALLTENILMAYTTAWTVLHGAKFAPSPLPIKRACLYRALCNTIAISDTHEEMRLLARLTCMEVNLRVEDLCWLSSFIRVLSFSNIKSLSMNTIPTRGLFTMRFLRHLRVTAGVHHSFDIIHRILDSCTDLLTLSFDPNVFFRIEDLGKPTDRFTYKAIPHLCRHNLTSLRIASLCESPQYEVDNFLFSLLNRLPKLNRLCLGVWLGDDQLPHYSCLTIGVVNGVSRAESRGTPILTQLQQLCCLASKDLNGAIMDRHTFDERDIYRPFLFLSQTLPSLRCVILPHLQLQHLRPTIKLFRYSSIEVKHRCHVDKVFPMWEEVHSECEDAIPD